MRDGHEPLLPLYEQGLDLYHNGGLPRGSLPGWGAVDELYSVAPGQWTVVTGIPQSGKSEWVDALLVNLAEREPWVFAVYSPENCPTVTHLVKLIEKRIRKPFNPGVTPRMTEQEYRTGAAWVLEHFLWLATDLKTPDELIQTALSYQHVGKKRGIVLDPWNTLDHERNGMNETDYISYVLTEVTKLARSSQAHIWLVVHPTKIYKNKDGTRPIPSPYDISGSAHWYNKADNIVTIHRAQGENTQEVEVHVQKVRFKHIGHLGLATLRYDKVTGRYFEAIGSSTEFFLDPERGQKPPTLREPGQEG